jgi:flavin reductase (DIM6/NTAB) family NADH-FMN oxidoreductase RutF
MSGMLTGSACRDYYRALSGGVAVVTACGPAGWSGTTVSTTTSVSLDPPIMLCCLTATSRTLTAIRHAERFAIHLLADGQSDLADRFSRPPSDSSRFEGLGYGVRLVRGTPVIDGPLGVAWCDLHSAAEVGDHVVVYGQVTGVRVGPGRPLLWHQRAYQSLQPPAEMLAAWA